jgi:L-2-hydroxyglutarate oxidase LhgO
VAALYSPSTGVIDSHALMLGYLGDAQANGAMLALGSRLERAAVSDAGIELHVRGAEPVLARCVVNSADSRRRASRGASRVIRQAGAPRAVRKGNYYSLARRAPFSG